MENILYIILPYTYKNKGWLKVLKYKQQLLSPLTRIFTRMCLGLLIANNQ